MGEATLAGKGKITVKTDKGTEEIAATNIILATGARARELPGLEARRQAGLDLQDTRWCRRTCRRGCW